MKIDADSVDAYIEKLPPQRREAVARLRRVLRENLPPGFTEEISYGMIGFVVPHELYPAGYHVDPRLPLPFINIASQKNYISLYHSGLYSDRALLDWFVGEYSVRYEGKLDMGKSCIRFRRPEAIPFELIGELARKMEPREWIELYEESRSARRCLQLLLIEEAQDRLSDNQPIAVAQRRRFFELFSVQIGAVRRIEIFEGETASVEENAAVATAHL